MFLCNWWPFFCCHKRHSIQNLFQKLNISKSEGSSSEIWDLIFQRNTSFYCLDIVTSFLNYTKITMLWFYFYYFFFLSSQSPSNYLSNFSKTRIIVCFCNFFTWFFCTRLMEINNFMFRWWKTKIKTYSKTRANQNILYINAFVYYYSSLFLFLKTCTRDVLSVVIFHVQIESDSFRIIMGRHVTID